VKIYYQYSFNKTILPTKGDLINEINMLQALSRYAEVFYSGTRFCPDKPGYGLKEYSGSIASHVPSDCDVYYVRAEKSAFLAVPKGKPRLWMASPFDAGCYKKATAIATFTEAWSDGIRKGLHWGWVPAKHWRPRKNVLTIHQAVGDAFRPLQGSKKSKALRASFGGDFVIGHFGRIVHTTYPYALLKLWPSLQKKYPGLRMVFGTTKGSVPALPGIIQRKFSHEDIPFAISACDCILLSNWGPEWQICGCGKALEAAACGVPLILGYSYARAELVGEDYGLFLPDLGGDDYEGDLHSMEKLITKVIENKFFRRRAASRLLERIVFYREENVGRRLVAELGRL